MLLMFSLLPLLSGCDNEDDVIGIFTGKTWKLSRLTNKGSNAQFYPNLWNNNEEEMKKSLDKLYNQKSTFTLNFEGTELDGELIPDELVQRIVDSSNFNAAYACLRQVSFGLLDMAWYTRNTPFEGDVKAYEKKAWEKAQILPSVAEACMSTQFSHIFAGGYSAGYYSYKWAEVLDADAFSLFKQTGIFNPETAASFRENILSKGGTEHPMTLYKRFRGQEPTIDALLIRNGIKK